MQVTDTEILLSLNIKRYSLISSKDMLSLGLVGLLMFGGGIFWLTSAWGQVPAMLLPILLIGLGILFVLGSIIALDMIRQGDRRFVRIDHEGVFFSPLLPTVVKWSDISALVPYTWAYLGSRHAYLGVVPRDPEALFARIIEAKSKNIFAHVVWRINFYLYRHSRALTPLNIPQVILPVSLDELVGMIQERFSAELHENQITVQEWQQ